LSARFALRALGFGGILALHATVSLTLAALRRPRARLAVNTWAARRLLACLGVRVERVDEARPPRPTESSLLTSNHLGYLDALVFAAQGDVRFITSVEVRDTPFLGGLARLGRCLFVERRSRAGLRGETAEIARALTEGTPVALFAEGTSSAGETGLPFRRPLFGAALDARKPVDLFCLKALTVDGEPLSPSNRDRICYYGDLEFFPHLLALLRGREARLELRYLGRLEPRATDGPGELAEEAHHWIARAYHRPSVPERMSLSLERRAVHGGQPATVAAGRA
jgi:1-acyl-sn-glycerol-3-phosphate acyltransferase